MSQSKTNSSISRTKYTFISRKICLSCVAFILSVQRQKRIVFRFSTIVSKLQEQGVQDFVTMNKVKLEPYGDLADEAYSKLNETSNKNQDPLSQVEDNEKPGAECTNENSSEDIETNKTSSFS